MSPNLYKGETAVCGSPRFFLDDWGGDQLPQIGLQSTGHDATMLILSVGVTSSDYCHCLLRLTMGYSEQSPSLPIRVHCHALTDSPYLFLLKPQVLSLVVDIETASHPGKV